MAKEVFTPETVGAVIRYLRTANMMTQVELARHVEVSKNTVSAWENGLYFPSISDILALARVFCVCWDFFFDPMPCFDPEVE